MLLYLPAGLILRICSDFYIIAPKDKLSMIQKIPYWSVFLAEGKEYPCTCVEWQDVAEERNENFL